MLRYSENKIRKWEANLELGQMRRALCVFIRMEMRYARGKESSLERKKKSSGIKKALVLVLHVKVNGPLCS